MQVERKIKRTDEYVELVSNITARFEPVYMGLTIAQSNNLSTLHIINNEVVCIAPSVDSIAFCYSFLPSFDSSKQTSSKLACL
jgi:hypothetical protein